MLPANRTPNNYSLKSTASLHATAQQPANAPQIDQLTP
jgi:hypothetical protein